MHGVGLLFLVLASLGAPLATAAALRGNGRWRGYARLSLLAAVVSFFFLFVLVFALEIATTLGIYGFFLTPLGWVELMALRLRRLA